MKRLRPDTLAGMDEALVVALARSGEQSGFEELVRRRQSQIRALLTRLCRDPHLADDLAQETFLHAWRDLLALKAYAAFGGWLRRIAVTTWLQYQRRMDPLMRVDADALPEDAAESAVGERLDLDAALGRLTAVVRLCVVLSYQEGMSHSEIAEATGIPIGTIKTHVYRGSAVLRTFLGDYRVPKGGSHS